MSRESQFSIGFSHSGGWNTRETPVYMQQRLFATLSTLTLLFACADQKESVKGIGNWYLIRGVLDLPQDFSGEPEFYFINQDNRRTPIELLNWDASVRQFSFKISDANFIKFGPDPVESILSMGKTLRSSTNPELNIAGLNIEVFFRTEADNFEVASQPIRFSQFRISYNSLNRLSGDQLISLGVIQTIAAASVNVSLVGDANEPQGANQIVYIPFSQEIVEAEGTPYNTLNFSPVVHTADEAGKVRLEPILLNVPEAAFYIVSPSGCHIVTGRTLVSELLEKPIIPVPACQKEGSADSQSLRAAFNEPDRLVVSARDFDPGLDDEPFIYTNEPVAKLTIWSSDAASLRPFRVEVFTENSTDGRPEITQDYNFFISEVSFDLPVVYPTGSGSNLPDGRFIIKISTLGTERQEINLGGRLQTKIPIAQASTAVQFVDSIDDLAIVSEATDQIRVSVRYCELAEGVERTSRRLGLALGQYVAPSFLTEMSCPEEGGEVVVSLKEVMEASAFSTLGGVASMRYLLRDAYGNWSDDDQIENSNVLGVYFDYGKADLQTSPFVFDREIGITSADNDFESKPSCIFAFSDCASQQGVTEWSLSSGGAGFRFRREDDCKTDLVAGDGSNSLAQTVARYVLKSDDTPPEDQAGENLTLPWHGCTEVFDLGLVGVQPPGVGQELSLFLFVMDHAGNVSNAQEIKVTSCGSGGSSNVCWKD
jgi:hypothetical protein